MTSKNMVINIFNFFKENKKWWLIPLVVCLFIVGLIIYFGQIMVSYPFMYVLF